MLTKQLFIMKYKDNYESKKLLSAFTKLKKENGVTFNYHLNSLVGYVISNNYYRARITYHNT